MYLASGVHQRYHNLISQNSGVMQSSLVFKPKPFSQIIDVKSKIHSDAKNGIIIMKLNCLSKTPCCQSFKN
jgi:hypothetical protein